MRVALLSDVHANLHALRAVLDHVDASGVDRIYCLGDVVGYNAFPLECTNLVRERADFTILGNHDWAATVGTPDGFNPAAKAAVEYSRRLLDDDARAFLSACSPHASFRVNGMRLDLFHGSPREPLWEYVFPDDAPPLFDQLDHSLQADTPRVIALGHTHVPMILAAGELDPADVGELPSKFLHSNLDKDRAASLLLLNPGSVGQPRDGDPRAAYATLHTDSLRVQFHRVEYDVGAAARAVRDAGLPGLLADRLFRGR